MNSAQICFRAADAHAIAKEIVELLTSKGAIISYGISVEHGKIVRYDHKALEEIKPSLEEIIGGPEILPRSSGSVQARIQEQKVQ